MDFKWLFSLSSMTLQWMPTNYTRSSAYANFTIAFSLNCCKICVGRNLQWQNLSISTSLLWYFWTLRLFPTNRNSINKGPPVWRKPFQCRSKTNKKTTDKIMGPTLKSQTYTTNLPNKARWWETLCVVIFIGNLWFAMCVKIQNFPNKVTLTWCHSTL